MTHHEMIFVNLPVADLARSRAFFDVLGYAFDDDFCDEQALCLRIGPSIYAMLLREELFARFHDGRTAGAGCVETLLCVSAPTRESVDELVDRAVLAGGRDVRTEDHGFMYGRSYADPDGHVWEVMWMDPGAARGGPTPVEGETVEVGGGTTRQVGAGTARAEGAR